MNQSTKCILYTSLAVIFLLAACAPAPAPTQDPADVKQQIEQSVALTIAAQDAQEAEAQALAAPTNTALPTQTAVAPATETPLPPPTVAPIVITPDANSSSDQAPTITRLDPNNGPIAGGTRVTITGLNLTDKTVFVFDTVEATVVDCINEACIVISPGIKAGVSTDQDIVVQVQAYNGKLKSELNKDSAFKYLGTPKYGCDAITIKPEQGHGPFKPGESFKAEWLIKNIGTVTWPAGLDIKFSGGVNMTSVDFVEIGKSMKPNDTIRISLTGKAPKTTGLYI